MSPFLPRPVPETSGLAKARPSGFAPPLMAGSNSVVPMPVVSVGRPRAIVGRNDLYLPYWVASVGTIVLRTSLPPLR